MTNFSFGKEPFSGIRHLKSHYKPRPDAVLVCSPSRNHSTKSGRNQRVCPSGADSSRLLCAANRCAPAPGSASRGWWDAAVISSRPGFRGSRGTPGPRPNGPQRPWQRSVPRRRSLPTSESRNAPRPLRFVNTVEYLTFTITCKYSGHFLYETLFFFFFFKSLSLVSLSRETKCNSAGTQRGRRREERSAPVRLHIPSPALERPEREY